MERREQGEKYGVLFKNTSKKNENDRDYNGSATVEGVSYWISAWIKQNEKGTFLSLSFKPKQAPKPTGTLAEQMNDEIPF